MSKLTDKISYLQGLADGLKLNPEKESHRLIQGILEVLQEVGDSFEALTESHAELSEYVEAGSLTQEQADLILDNVKARIAAKNGECPNCGYQFRDGDGNRARGGKGGRNGQFQNGGQMPRGNQMPDAQSGATPRQGGMQMMPGAGQPQM